MPLRQKITDTRLALPKPKDVKSTKRKNHVRRNINRELAAQKKQADALVREIVFTRDGRRCVKCGTDKALTPSHIRPRGKCPRMTWMPINVLTMCAACHLHWWHKDPVAAIGWLQVTYPGLLEKLLLWERIAPKVDMKALIIGLEFELSEIRCSFSDKPG